MTLASSTLENYSPYSGNDRVVVGNGASLPITYTRSCNLSRNVHLLDVLVVPHITKNLLSISKLTSDYPVNVVFSNVSFTIQNRVTQQTLAQGRYKNGLYILERAHSALVTALRSKALTASFEDWHCRLGDVLFYVISTLNKLGHVAVTSVLPKPSLC